MSPKKIKFYLGLAQQVAKEATCPRASVGAVLVKDDRVISLGYNGSLRNTTHCKEEGCWLQPKEDRQACVRAVHAEANALVSASYGGATTKYSILFCTHKPCIHCLKLLIGAGVGEIFYLQDYPDQLVDKLLDPKDGDPLIVLTQVNCD